MKNTINTKYDENKSLSVTPPFGVGGLGTVPGLGSSFRSFMSVIQAGQIAVALVGGTLVDTLV